MSGLYDSCRVAELLAFVVQRPKEQIHFDFDQRCAGVLSVFIPSNVDLLSLANVILIAVLILGSREDDSAGSHSSPVVLPSRPSGLLVVPPNRHVQHDSVADCR